jgi:hypothetical protein
MATFNFVTRPVDNTKRTVTDPSQQFVFSDSSPDAKLLYSWLCYLHLLLT